MKLSRIEPMQTHEPDEQKEETLAVADIKEKSKSVNGVNENQTDLGDVLSEETKGGLKRLAEFLNAKSKQNEKKKAHKESPSLKLKAIKSYQAIDLFELSQNQKATKIKKSA